MKRKTIIILSFISIFLSLIYILLNYFGLLRYIELYVSSTKKYQKKYSSLDKGDPNNRVIISINTVSTKNLKYVVNSLLDQTVKVDLISINVPSDHEFKIPENLKDSVKVYKCNKNYKDSTCLIPSVLRESNYNTKIITLADNKIYGKDFIEQLIDASIKNSDSIIYTGDKIDINNGVLFNINFFDDNFINNPDIKELISKNLKHYNISYKENYKTL